MRIPLTGHSGSAEGIHWEVLVSFLSYYSDAFNTLHDGSGTVVIPVKAENGVWMGPKKNSNKLLKFGEDEVMLMDASTNQVVNKYPSPPGSHPAILLKHFLITGKWEPWNGEWQSQLTDLMERERPHAPRGPYIEGSIPLFAAKSGFFHTIWGNVFEDVGYSIEPSWRRGSVAGEEIPVRQTNMHKFLDEKFISECGDGHPGTAADGLAPAGKK